MGVIRLAVVTSHPIQYAAPLYSYLNRDPGVDVTALFCTDFSLRGATDPGFARPVRWDVDLLEGYRSVFLGSRARSRNVGGFWSLVCPELISELSAKKYDAVLIHGQQFAAYLLSFVIAKLRGIPVLTRGETHLSLERSAMRKFLRNIVLRLQYKFIDGFLAIGSENYNFYRALGVEPGKIFMVPYSVDNERHILAAKLGADVRKAQRARLGVFDDRPIVFFASKLSRRKHPDDLVYASARLADEGLMHHVVFAGSGEMESELKLLVSDLGGLARTTFAGFVNQSELPKQFASCDVFVLPSENEPWGLVVNEAMCAGLPVVVGRDVGCVTDLVTPGINGATCVAGSPDSLADALRPLLCDPSLRKKMGQRSLSRIRGWGYKEAKMGIMLALKKVCNA